MGETVLFFGCRNRNEDYIYEDELTNYEKDGTLAQLSLAFSRDQVIHQNLKVFTLDCCPNGRLVRKSRIHPQIPLIDEEKRAVIFDLQFVSRMTNGMNRYFLVLRTEETCENYEKYVLLHGAQSFFVLNSSN